MHSIRFWLSWSRADRGILLVASLLFIFTLSWLWYAYFQSPAPVIEFQSIQESELSEIPVDRFQKGIFEFAIAGNNYSITERFLGTPLRPNPTAAYIYLLTFIVAITGLLTVVTTLNRFYYLVCMGLFILLVVNLKFEVLEIFGLTDKTFTIGVLSVYILASFYIFYFAPSFTFISRAVIFTGITIVVGLFILFFSETPLPFLHLATFSVPAGIVGAGLFILMVAHEIIAAFIFVVTQGTKQTKSLNHFLIITAVYLVNLALAYSVKFGFIQWNLITINLFLLLSISAVLGIWGIRQRQKQFGSIIDVEPFGVFGFLFLGSVCFGATAFFLASANDPVVDAISDSIIFAHIGYGIIFLTYVLSNFIGMLGQNLRVHRVLYNPTNMPYFTFRFAGLIATLAFVFYNTWQVLVHNAFAGFYNANGDLYLSLNNHTVAQLLYDQGRTYGFSNHHSNYALANMEGARFNTAKERGFYRSAVYKRPTEMAYLNLAQTYQTERNLLEAILVLNEGQQKFPDSGPLKNTLGLLYEQANVPDSAVFHLRAAASGSFKKEVPEINLLSLSAKNKIKLPIDSTISENDEIGMKANKLGWANANKRLQVLNFELPKDTALNLSQAVYINNYLINHLGDVDSAVVNSVIQLSRKPVNSGFREALMFSSALSLYAASEVQKAFRLLEEVTIGSSNQGKYNNILTLWTLEQNEPERALGYVNYAIGQQYQPASVSNAVALTEVVRVDGPSSRGKLDEAKKAWDSLKVGHDTIVVSLARRMANILWINPSHVSQLTDEDQYAYCRYRLTVADSVRLLQIVSEIKNEDYKARTLLEFSKRLFDMDELKASISAFQRIKGMQLSDKTIYDDIRLHELLLLAKMRDTGGLIAMLKNDFDFSGKRKIYKTYFEALITQAAGDTLKATALYEWVGQANPFFDDGVIAAAEYFRVHGPDKFLPYRILVDAVQNHPSSVKVLKSYCLEAARQGYSDFAEGSLLQLRQMISPAAYRNFVDQNREVFEVPAQ